MNLLLPEVVSVAVADDGLAADLALVVPEGLAHFPGHYAGRPILPGVVQVDWAVHFARAHLPALAAAGPFRGMENLKFLRLVLPEARLTLALRWLPAKSRLDFVFTDGERTCASGGLLFGPAP